MTTKAEGSSLRSGIGRAALRDDRRPLSESALIGDTVLRRNDNRRGACTIVDTDAVSYLLCPWELVRTDSGDDLGVRDIEGRVDVQFGTVGVDVLPHAIVLTHELDVEVLLVSEEQVTRRKRPGRIEAAIVCDQLARLLVYDRAPS